MALNLYETPEERMNRLNAGNRASYAGRQAAYNADRTQMQNIDSDAITRRLDAGDVTGAQRYANARMAYDMPGKLGDAMRATMKALPGIENPSLAFKREADDVLAKGADLGRTDVQEQVASNGLGRLLQQEGITPLMPMDDGSPRMTAPRPVRSHSGGTGRPGPTWSMGSIDGREVAVPTAGNYTNGAWLDPAQGGLGSISPDLTSGAMYGVDGGRVRQAQAARQYLDAGLPVPKSLRDRLPMLSRASDIAGKLDMRAQEKAQKDRDFQMDLAGVRYPGSRGAGGKKGDTVDEANQKTGARQFYDDRAEWNKIHQRGQSYKALYDSAIARGASAEDVFTDPISGKDITVADAGAFADSLMATPEPRFEDYGLQAPGATSASGTPEARPWFGGGKKAADKKPATAGKVAYDPALEGLQGQALQAAFDRAQHKANDPKTPASERAHWAADLAYLQGKMQTTAAR